MTLTKKPRRGGIRLLLATASMLGITLAVTAASFTDQAVVNLGTGTPGSGIGNPNTFDIAVHDQDGQLQDAATEAAAVVLDLVIQPGLTSGTELSEETPVVFEAVVDNRVNSMTGHLVLRLFDPDPTSDDVFDDLVFTLSIDGTAPAELTSRSASEVNAAGYTIADVAPGGSHTIEVSAVLAPGAALAAAGKATQLGLRVEGESA